MDLSFHSTAIKCHQFILYCAVVLSDAEGSFHGPKDLWVQILLSKQTDQCDAK